MDFRYWASFHQGALAAAVVAAVALSWLFAGIIVAAVADVLAVALGFGGCLSWVAASAAQQTSDHDVVVG